MKRAFLPAAALLLAACVPVPEYMQEPQFPTTLTTGVYRDLDPGYKEESGLHFKVKAYGSDRAQKTLALAEENYQRIMNDSALYSFQPRGLYEIVVYGSADEFHKKTQFPEWAAGLTVGNSICSYEGPQLGPTLAHEMTHLIFHEYMTADRPELRWINEGFAMYEESHAAGGSPFLWPPSQIPLPFDQMAALVPASEREKAVSMWYRQVSDVVGFAIERGGRIGFGQWLQALRDRRSMDDAIRTGFPGVWGSLKDIENAWLVKVSNASR